jgi:hypothetical protein
MGSRGKKRSAFMMNLLQGEKFQEYRGEFGLFSFFLDSLVLWPNINSFKHEALICVLAEYGVFRHVLGRKTVVGKEITRALR